ncbi:MAG: PD40 domain-containing protein [Prevotella sp.]|nr:PD40 domain-containing protein [Prevotella sp.]
MKQTFFTLLCLASLLTASAQEEPLWMRYPAISPDGQTIVFSYKGDLFTVAATGGSARQLTTNPAYDAYPVWSPDGKQIAFASTREGSFDIYLIDKTGGTPKRLTTHSADEYPIAFSDNNHVLYSSALMPTAKSGIFANRDFPQIYEVATDGSRPRLYSVITMEDISINPQGDILYHDKKGYEDAFRKHHQSSICRDIWLLRDGKHTKLTTFRGEDRTPVWAPDGQSFYYLSEQDGTFNVWKRGIDGSGEQQITHHVQNPVRFLTMATDGTLCYGYDGEIYTNKDGKEQKVSVSVIADRSDTDLRRQLQTSGATEICVSPKGKEIAFVMHGDVYVTSIDYKTTKQITDTPEQERGIDFAPDGRSIVYGAERGGHWQIYRTTIKNKDEKQFAYATDLIEERLITSDITSLQPKYSPDGKEIAFFEDRGALRVLNLATKQVRTVLDAKYNFSYSDGDLWFEWSPDSRWLLSSYIGTGGWNNSDIALVDASGNQPPHNLTNSGYNDGGAKWVLGGKAMLYESDRAGYRSHGSWGAETDAYLMFFDLDAYERFRMTKEEKALYDEAEKERKKAEKEDDKTGAKGGKGSKGSAKSADNSNKRLELDLENARDRIVRLTVNSSRLGDYVLSPGGDTLYYQAAFEGGFDLWKHDFLENRTELVMKDVGRGGLQADKEVKNLYLNDGRGIKKIDLGKKKTETIAFEAPFNYRPYVERQYLFDHIWQQVDDKFYDPNMHGVDWKAYRKVYEKFLPHINNNHDFSNMLSEMLGELNASHTGARYSHSGASLRTANLGVFIDPDYEGDGIRIEETIKRSPLALKNIPSGSIIEKIDGTPIIKGMDYNYLLDGKIGKPVRLTIDGKDVTIRPISQADLQELLYKRWVDRNRHIVDSLSGGKLAYVHVKAMNSPSFRQVYSDLLSDENRNREAVIVDERYNGGGWLHDDLCTLLSGKQYQSFVPHGKYVGYDPFNKWVKPSCVLICEDDYSNGHGFPWVYRELGIGKLIGAPVAGTMTAVWWETLMDRSLVFGIPQVGCLDMHGKFGENNELFPDIEVYNTPEDYINGRDRQLEAAVEEMLKQIQK